MTMNTDMIVGSMDAAEALTMALKCLAKLSIEQLQTLVDEAARFSATLRDEIKIAETEKKMMEDEPDEEEQ